MEKIGLDIIKKMIIKINDTLQENKMILSQLDSVIGDGDHGISISKGFLNAVSKIQEQDPKNISDLLKLTGNSIAVIIGGVTGPIFGMFFSEMGRSITPDIESLSINDFSVMFEKALDKIMQVGGAKPGEKTMVDALFPAVQSLKKSASENESFKHALLKMVNSAKTGAESTKEMVATKGRARYSGERSLGYEDAGANTVYFILQAMYEAM